MTYNTTHRPPLDAQHFDNLLLGPEKIWGLQPIADVLGCSIDKVRRLSKLPHTPIYQPEERSYFAFRSELVAWLRSKAVPHPGGGSQLSRRHRDRRG